jgi:hypothetical protein
MRLRSMIAAAVLALAFAVPSYAGDKKPDPLAQLEPQIASGVLYQGLVREEDVTLLFAHIREALAASRQGREAPPPPEALNRRAQEIAAEIKARGTLAGLLLLTAFEAAALQALREAQPAPAPGAR